MAHFAWISSHTHHDLETASWHKTLSSQHSGLTLLSSQVLMLLVVFSAFKERIHIFNQFELFFSGGGSASQIPDILV